jgi:hypothetical protein
MVFSFLVSPFCSDENLMVGILVVLVASVCQIPFKQNSEYTDDIFQLLFTSHKQRYYCRLQGRQLLIHTATKFALVLALCKKMHLNSNSLLEDWLIVLCYSVHAWKSMS